ncbi:lipoprotein [Streptococcus agalactiae]|nr:lipoprotein [Streptococcus agalactiae]CNJ83956.1 lipoprotein [Streptococcus agalactiae]
MFLNNRNFGHVQSIYYTEMAKMYIMIMLIIFIVFSGIYYFYYLPKNQGKKWKFNQWKLQKGKKEQLKINYGIIPLLYCIELVVCDSNVKIAIKLKKSIR